MTRELIPVPQSDNLATHAILTSSLKTARKNKNERRELALTVMEERNEVASELRQAQQEQKDQIEESDVLIGLNDWVKDMHANRSAWLNQGTTSLAVRDIYCEA